MSQLYQQFFFLFSAVPKHIKPWQLTSLRGVIFFSLLLSLGQSPAYGQRLAAGDSFTVTVRSDGSLWAWGWNIKGEVGDGTTTMRTTPLQVGTATNWRSVASCDYHTLAIRTDGTLWGWGDNGAGQLGLGHNTDQLVPVQVGTAQWRSVAVGPAHTVGVRADGTLWAWGQNGSGQLGDGTTTSQTSPIQIGTDTTWRSATAQEQQTLALRRNGTLWGWGDNFFGQLGLGVLANPKQLMPVQVGTATWQSVSTCYHHTAAVRTDGTLWTWGQNNSGQLGDGTTYSSDVPHQIGTATTWRSATAGQTWMLGIQTDGSLWGWGYGPLGDLAIPTASYGALVPTRSGTATTWQAVVTGGGHTVAVQTDGSLWAWGSGGSGQIGSSLLIPDPQFAPIPLPSPATWQSIAVGTHYMVGLRPDGTLWSWGDSFGGQLGNAPVGGYQFRPVQVGTDTWQQVAAGDAHTVAVRADGTLWAWGNNLAGQLGLGSSAGYNQFAPGQVGTDTNWRSVAAGLSHTVAVRTDGSLWAWGLNADGQLGDGTTTTRLRPVRIGTGTTWQSVAAGATHTLAVRQDGTLWAWGNDQYGQTGNGTNSLAPVQVGTDTNWQQVAAGKQHTLALRTNGTLWTWGNGQYGRLGLGTTTTQYLPAQVGTATWQSIAAGDTHSLAVRTDGTLWGWGYNSLGVLGDPGTVATFVLQPVQVGTTTTWQRVSTNTGHSAFVRTDNSAWVCGSNRLGQLGTPSDSYSPLLILTEGLALAVRPSSIATLQLLPNPAHDQVQLPGAGSSTALRLFDLQGRLLRTGTGRRLLLQELPAGVYLLQAKEAGQGIRTARLQVE